MEEKNSVLEDAGRLAGVKCRVDYARKKGKDHITRGTLCQDYSMATNIGKMATVVAVADGHGGSAYEKSDRGSRFACEAVSEIIAKYLENSNQGIFDKRREDKLCDWLKSSEFKEAFIKKWQAMVIADYKASEPQTAEPDGRIITKYGTTILFAVITKKYIVAGQLGDGAIMLSTEHNYQLLKRHRLKTESKTSSLASGRGIYAFTVEKYSRDLFDSVLLTTDGIYDRLDKKGALLMYANELKKQIKIDGSLVLPFTVAGIDVSDVTRDDCTVALITLDKKAKGYKLTVPKKSGYSSIEFERAYDSVVIYSAQKNGERVEIHVTDDPEREVYTLDSCSVLSPIDDFFLSDGKKACVYPWIIGAVRLQELIEYEDHIEKRYPPIGRYEDDDEVYTNEFWLDVCERIKVIKKELSDKGFGVTEAFFKTAYVTDRGEITAFCDSLCEKDGEHDLSEREFELFYDRFAHLGRLRCGDIEIPLFKCANRGQTIPLLHSHGEGALGRILYNSKHQIYGLWNESGSPWYIEGEDRIVENKKLLLLDKSCAFTVAFDGNGAIFGAELSEKGARYEVIFL